MFHFGFDHIITSLSKLHIPLFFLLLPETESKLNTRALTTRVLWGFELTFENNADMN